MLEDLFEMNYDIDAAVQQQSEIKSLQVDLGMVNLKVIETLESVFVEHEDTLEEEVHTVRIAKGHAGDMCHHPK